MLAFIGMIVQELGITFPGYISPSQKLMFSDLGTEPLAAWSKLPDAGKAQIITAIFCVEFAGEFAKPHYTKGGPMPPQFDAAATMAGPVTPAMPATMSGYLIFSKSHKGVCSVSWWIVFAMI